MDGPTTTPNRPARRRRRAALAALAVLVLFALAFHRFLFLNNFAAVDPGLVYRSAQPGRELPRTIADYRLRTVLNLRGGGESDRFYGAEIAAAAARGADFYDLPMLATERPARCELLALIDLFGRCRYPLLIHCKSGSDRTGLASALYLMTRRDLPPERALAAFSIFRGHVPLLGPERLQAPLREYAAWLADRRLAHTPGRFRDWVQGTYRDGRDDSGPTSCDCPPLRPGPRPPAGLVDGRRPW